MMKKIEYYKYRLSDFNKMMNILLCVDIMKMKYCQRKPF